MEKMNDLKDLLKHEIEDLYSVEEQILEALPKMIDKASNTTLKNALSEHLRITEEHKTRLEKIQKVLDKGSEGKNDKKKGFLAGLFGGGKHVCKGMQGIIDEGHKVMNADMTPEVMDAAILACAQKVEHYEICGYGTARTYARELGMEKEARLLEQTLNEEYQADDRLTALAVQRINLDAGLESVKGGDSSASGTAKGRSGREAIKERATRTEEVMEPVSRNRGAEKKNVASERGSGGKPRAASAPRNSSVRTASKTSGSSRTTKTSGKSSGTSASGGRSGSGRNSSTSRGN